jgi:glutathione S-transferase
MLKIHADPITINCRKVLAGLQFVGAEYELVSMNFFAGDHTTPEHLKLNPNATVPVAVDDDLVLWESNAILQYAADKVGNASAYPTELKTRADVNRWLLWEASVWFPCCYAFLVENVGKPMQGEQPDSAVLEAQAERFHALAAVVDARLANHRWIAGDAPTIADIALAAPIHMHLEAKVPLAAHKNLQRWMRDDLEKLPSWENTYVGPGFSLERPAN